ncbi:hypothetical protein C5167_035638, partial [Papaver somniferum]
MFMLTDLWLLTCRVVMIIVSVTCLRTRVVVLASQEAQTAVKPKRKAATQHGGSMLSDLQQSLEDHLPVLLGLVKEGALINEPTALDEQ